MQYKDTYHQFWFYPQFYRVRFTSPSTPKVVFTVSVQKNFEIPDEMRLFSQSKESADNYYIRCFEYRMNEYLLTDVNRIWGSNATVTVLDIVNMDGAFFMISPLLNNEMNLAEMEPLIDNYWIYISTDTRLAEESLEAIANQIFAFIKVIRDNGFEPATICLEFLTARDKTNSVIFDEWRELDSLDQIILQLRKDMEND